MPDRYPFAFDARFKPLLALIGVTPSRAWVEIGEDTFDAKFGPFRCTTSLSNITGVQISRDYQWFKAIGPRGSLADGGATFGSSTHGGVCVLFERPVPALLPGEIVKHPGLTVTVKDLDGLAERLRRVIDGA